MFFNSLIIVRHALIVLTYRKFDLKRAIKIKLVGDELFLYRMTEVEETSEALFQCNHTLTLSNGDHFTELKYHEIE